MPSPNNNSLKTLPEPQLSDNEDQTLCAVIKGLQKDGTTDDFRWFKKATVWTEARADCPILPTYTDTGLKRAYLCAEMFAAWRSIVHASGAGGYVELFSIDFPLLQVWYAVSTIVEFLVSSGYLISIRWFWNTVQS